MSRAKAIVEEEFFANYHDWQARMALRNFIEEHIEDLVDPPYAFEGYDELAELMCGVRAATLIEQGVMNEPSLFVNLLVGGIDRTELVNAITAVAGKIGGADGQELLRKFVGRSLEGPSE